MHPGHQDRRAAMWRLLAVDNGKIVPSQYTRDAKAAGLDIITWTSSVPGACGGSAAYQGHVQPSFYFQTTLDALHNDGD